MHKWDSSEYYPDLIALWYRVMLVGLLSFFYQEYQLLTNMIMKLAELQATQSPAHVVIFLVKPTSKKPAAFLIFFKGFGPVALDNFHFLKLDISEKVNSFLNALPTTFQLFLYYFDHLYVKFFPQDPEALGLGKR